MNIEQELEDIKNWTNTKNILFVEGNLNPKKSAIVEIPNNGIEAIELYKRIAERLGVKIIIFDLLNLDAETYSLFQTTIEDIAEEEIKEAFESLRNFENRLLGYSLSFFDNGIMFQIENYLEETNQFMRIQSSVNHYFREENSKFKTLPEEKVTAFGEELANHENYLKLKSRAQRQNLARQLFSKQLEELKVHDFYINSIVTEAESYYEIEIKPKIEAKLKQQISELFDSGWTKVKIAAELGVSKDTVNKYI